MRLLVTGAGGQLGSELARCADDERMAVTALSRADCDITDAGAVSRVLGEHAPDALINCAAWTDVDGAETHHAEAFLANALGPQVLADACARRDVLLVQLSTDYVFAGSAHAVDEDEPPSPVSVYGHSKLAGEREVRTRAGRYLIVRTSGLYGCDGPNFVLKVLRRAAGGGEVRVVTDQVTSPTWTAHLAAALLQLVAQDATGTYHLTNSGSVDWYTFAATALDLAGHRTPVHPVTTESLGAAARRPQHAVLENRAWARLGQCPLPPWQEALAGYISSLRARGALPL